MKASMFIAIAALSLASCTDYLTPEGEVVEREIEIPQSINEIEIGDGMTLILSDDVPAGKAVIRTHGNIQPYIKAEIPYRHPSDSTTTSRHPAVRRYRTTVRLRF